MNRSADESNRVDKGGLVGNKGLLDYRAFQQVISEGEGLMSDALPINRPLLIMMS